MESPAVITSKMADDHYNMIKANHSDILKGIQDQAVKVQQYNMQKDMDRQQKEAQAAETMKNQLEQEQKQQELAIKAAALSM